MYTFLLGIDLFMLFSYAFEFNIRTNKQNCLTHGITEPDCNLICIDWKIGLNGT